MRRGEVEIGAAIGPSISLDEVPDVFERMADGRGLPGGKVLVKP